MEDIILNVPHITNIGIITDKDFGKLLGLFTKDVIDELYKDEVLNIKKSDKKLITKQISVICANFIREHFLDIIDNQL